MSMFSNTHFGPEFLVPNTLGVESRAAYGGDIVCTEDLIQARELALANQMPLLILGQGSNIIPLDRIAKCVGVMQIKGIEVIAQDQQQVSLRVGAGEDWHGLVMHTLANQWYGLENLALIPGTVGAAPVQNIGAYGVEIGSMIESVEVLDKTGQRQQITNQSCQFGYRKSTFQQRPDLTIVAVTLRLSKQPNVQLAYADLQRQFTSIVNSELPSPELVAEAVIQIRSAKLPDPQQFPNVGSFFKNPIISNDQVKALRKVLPDLNVYEMGDNAKINAAQLIDRAGWKNKAAENVYCWQRQPLVIVNQGASSASEVLNYADAIKDDIRVKFQVELEVEPSVVS